MGSGKRRFEAFKAGHPVCCFCGAVETQTRDHIPARECFKRGIGPEGYEFPACERCNRATSQIEQGIALLIRLADFDDSTLDDAQLQKLFWGVANNTPELLPADEKSVAEKRRLLRSIGYVRGPGEVISEVPVMRVGEAHDLAFQVFTRKLTCALYYKELGAIMPTSNLIRTSVFQFADPAAPNTVEKLQKLMPRFVATARRNTNIGDQFRYVCGATEDRSLFAFCAQFSKAYFVVGGSGTVERGSGREGWIAHSEDLPDWAAANLPA